MKTTPPPLTALMCDLSARSGHSVRLLQYAKMLGHFTDFGLAEAIKAAECTGVGVTTVAELYAKHGGAGITYPRRSDPFVRTQIEYHGCDK